MPYFEGPLNCKIAFVGEAPGYDETRLGHPFVGAAGQELNKLLASAGIQRTQCYLTNVMKVRPPNNDISHYINLNRKTPIITSDYKEHELALRAELKECKANVVVALGNTALYTLTGYTGIMKRRGSLYTSRDEYGSRKVLACIHPSAALRQYILRWFIALDLQRAVAESEYPELQLPERELLIGNPTPGDIYAYLASIHDGDTIAIDIEVWQDRVSHISIARSPFECLCIPFISASKSNFSIDDEAQIWHAIASVLENPSIIKVGQNLAFDFTFLYQSFGIKIRPLLDTMIYMGILYPDFPKGLDFITSVYTKEPYYKDEGKKWFKMIGGDEMAFRRYNALDSAVCIEALPKLRKEAVETNIESSVKRQTNLVEPLVYMGSRGIRMDVDHMQAMSKQTGEQLEALLDEFYKACGKSREDNAKFHNSPKQIAYYFYGERGLQPYYKKGSVTVDEKALKRLSRKGVGEATLLLKIRELGKLKSTYLDMHLDPDNRLRCSFNPVGTTSGRLSSSKTIFGTGANMQNQPPEIKQCMVADPGYILVEFDKSQAENRVVAYVANEIRMIHAFETGQDVHKLTASLIYGVQPEDVDEDHRSWGKRANHGLNYDLGYKTFALYYEISEVEAKTIVEAYHRAYPAIRAWHRKVRDQLQKNRTLITCEPFARPRIFRDRWGDALFKNAYSYIPQSTVAEIVNQWGVCFVYYYLSPAYKVEILNQVHDSIVIQIPVHIGIRAIADCFLTITGSLDRPLSYNGRQFTIPTDIKVGRNLKDMTKIPKTVAEDPDDLYDFLCEEIDAQA